MNEILREEWYQLVRPALTGTTTVRPVGYPFYGSLWPYRVVPSEFVFGFQEV